MSLPYTFDLLWDVKELSALQREYWWAKQRAEGIESAAREHGIDLGEHPPWEYCEGCNERVELVNYGSLCADCTPNTAPADGTEGWAVVYDDGRYLCINDDDDSVPIWFQDSCEGWAVCSADRGYADLLAMHHDCSVVAVRLIEGAWTPISKN